MFFGTIYVASWKETESQVFILLSLIPAFIFFCLTPLIAFLDEKIKKKPLDKRKKR